MYFSVLYFKGRHMSEAAHVEDEVMEFWFKKEETRYYAHVSLCKAGNIISTKADTAGVDASFEMYATWDS